MEKFPFYLINGARSYEFFHTEHRQAPTMREFHPEPRVKVSPGTAAEYGLQDGDWIWMENDEGRCKQMVEVFAGIPDDCLSAEHGWWKPEEEGAVPHLHGCFDYNVNNLTRNFQSGPGGIGSPIKCTRCRIYKVKDGDVMPGEQITQLGGWRDDYQPMRA